MNSKTLLKFHRFGKVGKIAMTVFAVLAMLLTLPCLAATVYVSALPKDALTVRVADHAEFRIREEKFGALWEMLADGFSYAGEASPEKMLGGEDGAVMPPEDQALQLKLSFFDRSYSSAKIHSEGDTKVVEAESAPAEYRSTDLVPVLVALTLLTASAGAALLLLRGLFGVLAKSESPFCDGLVKKLKAFGISLLPVAVFVTAEETLSAAFLSAGQDSGLRIQWGFFIAFAVTMCLVTVFRYGVQLQRESDETL